MSGGKAKCSSREDAQQKTRRDMRGVRFSRAVWVLEWSLDSLRYSYSYCRITIKALLGTDKAQRVVLENEHAFLRCARSCAFAFFRADCRCKARCGLRARVARWRGTVLGPGASREDRGGRRAALRAARREAPRAKRTPDPKKKSSLLRKAIEHPGPRFSSFSRRVSTPGGTHTDENENY